MCTANEFNEPELYKIVKNIQRRLLQDNFLKMELRSYLSSDVMRNYLSRKT